MQREKRYNLITTCFFIVFSFLYSIGGWGQNLNSSNSVLSKGKWVKIEINKTGVYALTFDELKAMGFPKPEKVGVYGYGGALISENLNERPTDDLPPLPILQKDNTIFFFGQGCSKWEFNAKENRYFRTQNHYSQNAYLFLSDSPREQPLLISDFQNTSQEAPISINQSDGLVSHEKELYSLSFSGRNLWGENLSTPNSINFNLGKNAQADEGIKINYAYVALPSFKGSGTFKMSSNGTLLDQDLINKNEDYTHSSYLRGIYHFRSFSTKKIQQSSFPLRLVFSPHQDPAYLDFIEIQYLQKLHFNGQQLCIRYSKEKNKNALFSVNNILEPCFIFAIPKGETPLLVPSKKTLKTLSFLAPTTNKNGEPIPYFVFTKKTAYKPKIVKQISNQNIHGAPVPSLIIITTNELLQEAKRLALFHKNEDQITTLVVTQEEVFNEFSSGTPDASAYRLMNFYFYNRWLKETKNAENCPIQFLLFGDGAFDNRRISKTWGLETSKEEELLLTYQSKNSLNIYSYTSDDFFGKLNPLEDEQTIGAKKLTIGIGRIPARTVSEAKPVVDKIISYALNKDIGIWKSRACFIADNADPYSNYSHLRQANEMSEFAHQLQPELIIKKIFLDAYNKETVNGLTTFPSAKRNLFDELNKGILFLNYTGHGSPFAWTDEQILTLPDMLNFQYPHLPVWITATCDFSNFDNPKKSGGESVFLHPTSGAIALFTTTRVVMDIDNLALNRKILKSLLEKDIDGRPNLFGNILKNAKNERGGNDTINKLNFMLLGDPALRLRIPVFRAVISEINGQSLENNKEISLHALEKIKLKGSIQDINGVVNGDFSGNIILTVFEGAEERKTLEENIPKGIEKTTSFEDYLGLIYTGTSKVKSGYFESTFIVPKDLTYSKKRGKINLYAYSPSLKKEAMGISKSIRIEGGKGAHQSLDTIPPKILDCYLNKKSKNNFFLVGKTPIFVAEVFDLSGINLTGSGVGHNISLVIDNNFNHSFILNNYFQADNSKIGQGKITFPLPELEEGDHTATFIVWDIFNNVAKKSFSFRVNDDLSPVVSQVRAFPNPAKKGQTITFEIFTDSPNEEFNASLELFDFTGKLIARQKNIFIKTLVNQSFKVKWQALNMYNLPLETGFYFYRWTLKKKNKTQQTTSSGSLIINAK